jgi:DNA-binding NtrC family response regulator/tetratricopeptide (TPR) repeat protein
LPEQEVLAMSQLPLSVPAPIRRERPVSPHEALRRGDALLQAGRAREALQLATRALGRRPLERDLAARLRVLRGQALFALGQVSSARGEARRANELATESLTRARATELLALIAWREQDLDAAEALAEAALADASISLPATVRLLGLRGGILRDAGRLDAALQVEDRRVALAGQERQPLVLAEARCARAFVLVVLGRWPEAASDLAAAADLYRLHGDPAEHGHAGLLHVMVDLAQGELERARLRLARARDVAESRDRPRLRADVLLLESDVDLAAGSPLEAERAASASLKLYRAARDLEGECRARLRRSHALSSLERLEEAVREGKRAVALAPESRPDLIGMASIALGRAQLRSRQPEAAAETFRSVLAPCRRRLDLLETARLGLALTAGPSSTDPEVQRCMAALASWGDRRLVALCMGEVHRTTGETAPVTAQTWTPAHPGGPGALVAAVEAALDASVQEQALADALRELRRELSCERAALASASGGTLLGPSPRELTADDLACRLATASAPELVTLDEEVRRTCPVAALHGLAHALVVPLGDGRSVVLDRTQAQGPFQAEHLAAVERIVAMVLRRVPARAPVVLPGPRIAGIVGRSAPMLEVLARLERAARSEYTVHVHGETGTGKECFAAAVHALSRRSRAPFRAINAASLSDDLLESHLFGHTKGAFTGAVGDRAGLVAEAEGGTLFLDEVTDLSKAVQAKLLRFLQTRVYSRLGENVERQADVRVVTAGNVALEEAVARGGFRDDLRYRLGTVTLELPPLRDRGDDVQVLARHFIDVECRTAGRPPLRLSSEVSRALLRHAWPGNVRELQSEVRRWVVGVDGGRVELGHLSPMLRDPAPGRASFRPLREAQANWERDYLAEALRRASDNRTRAAGLLGITRQALLLKLARLGM